MSLNNCSNVCDDDALGAYEEVACGTLISGGTNAVILLTCDSQLTDASNGTQINAEIAAGRAFIITGASATLDAASPVTVVSKIGCQPDKVTNYNRVGTYYNPNVTLQNINLHSQINAGRTFGGMLIKECVANRVTWIDAALTFQGNRILTATDAEEQRIDATFNWKSLDDPKVFAMPAGVNW